MWCGPLYDLANLWTLEELVAGSCKNTWSPTRNDGLAALWLCSRFCLSCALCTLYWANSHASVRLCNTSSYVTTVSLGKSYCTTPIRTPVCLPVAHPYILHRMHIRGCVHFHLYAIVRARHKLRRVSHLCHRQLRCQACASVFIPQWLASVHPRRVLLACVFPSIMKKQEWASATCTE